MKTAIPFKYHSFLRGIFEAGGFVSGSFAATHAGPKLGFIPNDIDIWTRNEDNFKVIFNGLRNMKYMSYHGALASKYNDDSVRNLKKAHVFVPSHPIGFDKTIQLLETTGSPEEIVSGFDFTICMAYIQDLDKVHTCATFYQDVADKRLRFVGSATRHLGILSQRLIKYTRRGFIPEFEDILAMLAKVDLDNVDSIASAAQYFYTLYITIDNYDKTIANKIFALSKMLQIGSIDGSNSCK